MIKVFQQALALLLAIAGVSALENQAIPDVFSSEIGRMNNQSLFWGPYKSNLYFGVKPRTPNGLSVSLMWSRVEQPTDIQTGFRWTCEQGNDIHGYGWDEYDARKGGIQTIHDKGNGIDITTSFIKVPGGDKGGSWATRIQGKLREGVPKNTKTQLFFYIAQEGKGKLNPSGSGDETGYKGDALFTGISEELGDFAIKITQGQGEHPSADTPLSPLRTGDKIVVHSSIITEENIWQGKNVAFKFLQDAVKAAQEVLDEDDTSPPPLWQVFRIEHAPKAGNMQLVQRFFEGDFEFDITYSSLSAGTELTTADVTREIKSVSESFNQRFSKVLEPKAPFMVPKYQKFAKSMLSNLLGGIGYFHGEQMIDRSYAEEYSEENEGFWEDAAQARARHPEKLEGPYELFTSVPSRPFFPRGFLWDEGFHLIAMADWDMDLALQILTSWYKTMDNDGWIPREQILGPEARSKVPDEFQVQYPHYANPPTFFLLIDAFMDKLFTKKTNLKATNEELDGDKPLYTAHLDNILLGAEYLRKLYHRLRRQYDWFRKTQRGHIKSYDREAYSSKEAYRWRGRTVTHILTSGLDDYPRPQPPHPGELHVDLLSWVGLMTKSLMNIASSLGVTDEVKDLRKNLNAIERNLNDLHWSKKEGCYCDATIDDFEEHALVCHKGYVSIFPFLLGLMKPSDPKLSKILDLISDEDELWSPHGIRSLSQSDEFYETGENYWRSPVWMPINYLAVTQLYNLATTEGPEHARARKMYNALRESLVHTVYESWMETGFAWEQYNPKTGAGQRTQHFTGWTSLIVKIMAMEHLEDEPTGKDEL